MKILIVNSYYYPDFVGGAEKSTQLLAEEFKQKGHDVLVFTGKHATETEVNGVKIFRADLGKFDIKSRIDENGSIIRRFLNKYYEINNKSIYKQFANVIDEFKPDIVFTNNLYGLSSIVWKAAHDKQIPIIHTVHDYWIFDSHSRLINIIHKLFYRKRSNYVSCVTAPSQSTMNIINKNKSYFKSTTHLVIPNGMDFDIENSKNIIKRKIEFLKENDIKCLNIIFAGRIDKNKGILNLIDALKSVKRTYKLHICGIGPLVNEVNQICSKNENIIYYGKLSKEELQKVYLKCDVLVAPSTWIEPFGLVVIEAMINGCCVLGSNYGGISEIIKFTNGGDAFNPENIDEIRNSINSLTKDKLVSWLENINKNIEFYNIFNTTNKYLDEFDSIIKKKH